MENTWSIDGVEHAQILMYAVQMKAISWNVDNGMKKLRNGRQGMLSSILNHSWTKPSFSHSLTFTEPGGKSRVHVWWGTDEDG